MIEMCVIITPMKLNLQVTYVQDKSNNFILKLMVSICN